MIELLPLIPSIEFSGVMCCNGPTGHATVIRKFTIVTAQLNNTRVGSEKVIGWSTTTPPYPLPGNMESFDIIVN